MKKINIEGIKVIDCKECNGSGQILAPASLMKAACIFCNGKGSTLHGQTKLEEPVYQAALKIIWDFINGKEHGWYH